MSWKVPGGNDKGFGTTDTTWQVDSNITVSIWVYMTTAGMLVRKNPGGGEPRWNLDAGVGGGTNQVQFGAKTNSGHPNKMHSTAVTLNAWHHIVGRRGSDEITCALDGVIQTTSGDGTGGVNDGPVALGVANAYSGGSAGSGMAGWIAEFSLWNAILTDAQIGLLYKGVSPLLIRRSGLMIYAPIYGMAAPLPDFSGNGRHLIKQGTDANFVADETKHPSVQRQFGFSQVA
jgi:hypothetical protein